MIIEFNKTALVVDDDPKVLLLVSSILQKYQFQVFEAENGVEAISQFVAVKPSLMILDMNMPKMDGCSAAKAIRAMKHGNQCHIILFTAESDEYLAKDEVNSIVNSIVNKVDLCRLKEIINNFNQ